MKTDRLAWFPSKTFEVNGKEWRINVEIALQDDCRNGHLDFSFTGKAWSKDGMNKVEGAIHDEIVYAFPELEKFMPLCYCNYLGHPLYSVKNGQYHCQESKASAMRYLRITEEEYEQLSLASDKEEKLYFKYLLYSLGIVDRWKKEADEFIKFLEEKTGDEWVNCYKPEEERNVMRLTDEEKAEVEAKIADGYYTQEALLQRHEDRERAKQDAIRNEVIEKYNQAERKAREERDLMLYLFDNGMPIDNVIYYDHTKECVFNWLDFESKVTYDQFEKFVNKVDYMKLPKGIKFCFGKEDRKH